MFQIHEAKTNIAEMEIKSSTIIVGLQHFS